MTEDFPSNRVHQATAMIAAQTDRTLTDSMQLLMIRAAAFDCSIEDMALDVIDGVVRFDP